MKKVIKFYADWCGPCKTYADIFDKVSETHNSKAEFINVNVDKDTEGLAAEHKVRSIPHTTVIKENGTSVSKVGLLSESQLEELILS